MRGAIAILVVLVCAALAERRSHADELTASAARGGASAAVVLELLLPDIRLEFADERSVLLSWPLVVTNLGLHSSRAGSALGLQPFIEPQYRLRGDELRLLGGTRLLSYSTRKEFQLSPFVEAAVVAGTDGAGAMAGGGFTLGVPEIGITYGLVGRAIKTTEEVRYDLALDLTIPLSSDEY